MMKLSALKNIIRTVDENGCSQLAAQLIARWCSGNISNQIINVSSNAVFAFHNGSQKLILRFVPVEERAFEAIQGEIEFLNHLAGQGLRVNCPIKSLAGKDVETVQTEWGAYHAVVLEALDGKQIDMEELSAEQIFTWGQTLGRLHLAAEKTTGLRRASWQDQLTWAEKNLAGDDRIGQEAARYLFKRLSNVPAGSKDFGLIHYDFEADNIIWTQDGLGMIDFDDCARYWYAADIAYALRDAWEDCASKVDLTHPVAAEFIRGYRSVRPVSNEMLAELPTFMLLLNLLKYVELSRIIPEGIEADEPAWTQRLREKFKRTVEKYHQELAVVNNQ